MTPIDLISGRAADLSPALRQEPLLFADFHIHSRFSRATSPQMEVQTLGYWGRRKGIGLLGTGDFTHPAYFKELSEKLEPDASGFYRVRGQDDQVLFVPTAEISNIYKQGGKVRRVHTVLLARSLESVREINRSLASRGNIAADGRPILGFSARHLCTLVREIDPETMVSPAHIWTPWFSVLGEKSGFDSLAECFEDELPMVCGVETGLSSDPEMNWRLSQLDPYAIISNSDAHSPSRIGRECNAFRGPLTWSSLREILRTKDHGRFRFTVEFFPEEGKYHWPGHAACGPAIAPGQYRELQGQCPVCGKPLTGGVASRVEALADRPEGFVPRVAVPSVHLMPLDEIIGEALGKGTASRAVQDLWDRMVETAGNEMRVLLFMSEDEIAELATPRVAEAIGRVRRGEIRPEPGYDGVYGKIRLFSGEKPGRKKKTGDQLPLV